MILDTETCPSCGAKVPMYRNPAPTADILIYDEVRGIVLVERKNPPLGHALPGGFMDVGECIERTAVREAFEETGLHVRLKAMLGVYSVPGRDPRRHTITTTFLAEAENPDDLHGADDAATAAWYSLDDLPPLVFDHARMISDFLAFLNGRRRIADITSPETVAD